MIHRNDNKKRRGKLQATHENLWIGQLQIKYALDFRMFASSEEKLYCISSKWEGDTLSIGLIQNAS